MRRRGRASSIFLFEWSNMRPTTREQKQNLPNCVYFLPKNSFHASHFCCLRARHGMGRGFSVSGHLGSVVDLGTSRHKSCGIKGWKQHLMKPLPPDALDQSLSLHRDNRSTVAYIKFWQHYVLVAFNRGFRPLKLGTVPALRPSSWHMPEDTPPQPRPVQPLSFNLASVKNYFPKK